MFQMQFDIVPRLLQQFPLDGVMLGCDFVQARQQKRVFRNALYRHLRIIVRKKALKIVIKYTTSTYTSLRGSPLLSNNSEKLTCLPTSEQYPVLDASCI